MWTIETSSIPGLYDVYDEDGNRVVRHTTHERACLVAAAPDMRAALEVVKPFVGRWHDRMAQLIGQVHDLAERKFSLEKAGFFWHIEKARENRQVVSDALEKAKGGN